MWYLSLTNSDEPSNFLESAKVESERLNLVDCGGQGRHAAAPARKKKRSVRERNAVDGGAGEPRGEELGHIVVLERERERSESESELCNMRAMEMKKGNVLFYTHITFSSFWFLNFQIINPTFTVHKAHSFF